MPLNRAMFASPKLKRETVTLADGDVAHLIEMNGVTREAFERAAKSRVEAKDDYGYAATTVIYSVCDEQGNLIFDESDIPDLLRCLGVTDLLTVFTAATSLNTLSNKEIDAAGGKSSATPSPS